MDPSPTQLMGLLSVYIIGEIVTWRDGRGDMISDIPGIWLHHTADCQKYFVLEAKSSLITDGLWSLSRNPNYLGELFILGAFAGLT